MSREMISAGPTGPLRRSPVHQAARAARARVGALLLLALLTPRPVAAQSAEDRATARLLLQDADKKLAADDTKGALELFLKAHSLVPAPTVKVAIGRAMVKLGNLVDAQQFFLDAARSQPQPNEPAQFAAARDDARREADALMPRLGQVEIAVDGADTAKIVVTMKSATAAEPRTIKGEMLGIPRAVNPGVAYLIRAEAEGKKPAEQSVTVKEGERQQVKLTLETDPAYKPAPTASASSGPQATSTPTQPPARGVNMPLVIVGGSMLGVFGAVGAVTGLMSMSKVNDIKSTCQGTRCPPSSASDADSAKTLGWVSTVSVVLAAGGAGLLTVGLLSGGSSDTAKGPVNLRVGATEVSLEGKF